MQFFVESSFEIQISDLHIGAVSHCLKKEGLFLLHAIGSNVSTVNTNTNLWLTKYIFPYGMTPPMKQISAARSIMAGRLYEEGSDKDVYVGTIETTMVSQVNIRRYAE
jgi:cyclopropane fatty-acyl-phospholipid synthase-like methyltransferase